MGIIDDIINKIKVLVSDLKKNFELLVIISVMWLLALIGILFLKVYVGPLKPLPSFEAFLISLGFSQTFVDLLNGMVQVFIAAIYGLLWLYLGHRIVRLYFWRTIKKNTPPAENKNKTE
ncbi:MAG: hypothetical protein HWN66_16925 [Candidatus Helarchaeota archaeon]|nr:hypothetical protein [Candidatus Helarchaeota archaeon]